MEKTKILIVDDEFRMRKLVGDFLRRAGYQIIEAENGKKALEIISEEVDLIILDVMMPEYDGWTVCREIRKQYKMPIIMLTAKSEESDELFGFENGADEYITKPFSPHILVVRIKALLRRTKVEAHTSLIFGKLVIDDKAHQVMLGEQIMELSPKEYDILYCLARNHGIVLSREQILNQVWNYNYFGDLRTVDTHINRLRIKLGIENNFIHTIRGLGYKFEVKS